MLVVGGGGSGWRWVVVGVYVFVLLVLVCGCNVKLTKVSLRLSWGWYSPPSPTPNNIIITESQELTITRLGSSVSGGKQSQFLVPRLKSGLWTGVWQKHIICKGHFFVGHPVYDWISPDVLVRYDFSTILYGSEEMRLSKNCPLFKFFIITGAGRKNMVPNQNLKKISSGGWLNFLLWILPHLKNASCLKDVGSLL